MSSSVSARKKRDDGAVRVVGERPAQVLFGLLVAAAEESRHLEVPAAERAVGGSLLEGRDRASAPFSSSSLDRRLRYLRPWRRPNDSASAPMLAAIQKCPSGRFGSSAMAARAGGDAGFEQRLALGFAARGRPASSARAPASTPPRSPSGSPSAAAPRCRRPAARWRDRRAARRARRDPPAAARRHRRRGRVTSADAGERRARDTIRRCRTSSGSCSPSSAKIRRAKGCSTRRSASRSRCGS